MNDTTHRDIRQALFTALDLITARQAAAGTCEALWLGGAQRYVNAAVSNLVDAERCELEAKS